MWKNFVCLIINFVPGYIKGKDLRETLNLTQRVVYPKNFMRYSKETLAEKLKNQDVVMVERIQKKWERKGPAPKQMPGLTARQGAWQSIPPPRSIWRAGLPPRRPP